MIQFILGRAGYGKTHTVLRSISERADIGVRNMLLLVPETVSHITERALCEHAGNRISAHAEVVTFRRLCERVSSEAGRRTRALDAGGRMLLMSRAMRQASGGLTLLGRGMRAEFLEELLAIEEECRGDGVSPEALLSASESFNPPLSDKLHDLSLLLTAYQGALRDAGLDATDALVHLAEDADKLGYFRDREVWIDGFSGFSEVELDVIRRIFRQAKNVTVTLCADPESHSPAFSKPNRIYESLRRIAGSCRTDVLPCSKRHRTDALIALERAALTQNPAPRETAEGVEFSGAHTRYEECEFAAAKVLELVRRGYRYREIGVAARDFGSYSETLSAVFSYYGIPVYLNRKTDLLTKPVIALTCAVLSCIDENFRYEDVQKLIKTGLCGLSRRAADELERYLYLWNIHGKDWSGDAPFSRPTSGIRVTDEDEEKLALLNRLRDKIRTPLMDLKAALRTDKSGAGLAKALLDYYRALHLPRRLRARAKLYRLRGEIQIADEYGQFWEILLRVLENMAKTLGDASYDLHELIRLFMLTVSQYEVASIPVSLDRVHAGSIDRLGENSPKALILLGINDGEFPMRVKDSGPLSDSDRMRLEAHGISLVRNTERQVDEEFHLVYRALTLPSELLFLSHHEEESAPSFVYTQIQDFFPARTKSGVSDTVRAFGLAPALDAAMSGDTSFSRSAKDYFRTTEYAPLLTLSEARGSARRGPIEDPSLRSALFGRDIRLSATKIDTFGKCRFQYFARYGLHLEPQQKAEFDGLSTGTMVHDVLEHTVREMTDRGGARKFTAAEARNLAEEFADTYARETLGGLEQHGARFQYLFRRLKAMIADSVEQLQEELCTSNFTPVDFELRFGHNGELPAMTIALDDGTVLTLEGAVDRVDEFHKDGKLYLRVVDYKTGGKTFSVDQVLNGIGMQMLLYLFALEEFGEMRYHTKIHPAGVLYVPIVDRTVVHKEKPSDEIAVEKSEKQICRNGLLLDDPDLIVPSRFLPVKYNKDGSLSKNNSLATLEEFYRLRDRMHKILRDIGSALHAGKIEANPYYESRDRTSCDWCDYKAFCGFEPGVGGDKLRYLFEMRRSDLLKGGEQDG